MLIIRNEQEREQAGMVSLAFLCGACQDELRAHYPIIVVGDRHHTMYHLSCAAQLAAEIADGLAEYLSELKPPE